ncbi:MAG: hypothetical protein IT279_06395 [Ignavibacteriaceae bacterium]|nr:hypothetical protein [Ignavibacteriaceae bacterium]
MLKKLTNGLTALVIMITAFTAGCSSESDVKPFTGRDLIQLVESAAAGNEAVNERLGKLFDYSLPLNATWNIFYLDSLTAKNRLKFYYLLLESPNPVYNRFAVYDTLGNLYLLDKSLNGNLSVFNGQLDSIPYFRVTESFRTKDTLILRRLNIYTYHYDTYALAFRSFTFYKENTVEREQYIESISLQTIKTKFRTEPKSDFSFEGEIFTYDKSAQAYQGKYRYFDSMVVRRINSFRGKVSERQIFDKNTALRSTGWMSAEDSAKKFKKPPPEPPKGFTIFVPEGWKIRRDIFITAYIKEPRQGTLYVNDSQAASFSVIELAADDSAENHINHSLEIRLEKPFPVRMTELMAVKRLQMQFFEVSCTNKRYLIIFEAPSFSYEKHKDIYEAIINSFGVNC